MQSDNTNYPTPELVDLKVAARITGVSMDTFRRLVRAGGAPSPVRIRRAVRWRMRELMQWIDADCPASTARQAKLEGRETTPGPDSDGRASHAS